MKQIIEEVKELWPEARLLHGRPYHSESQGGVERLNRVVRERIMKWMKSNSSTRWSFGVLMVKAAINQQKSSTTKMTPYELVFCQSPRVGINTLPLSTALIDTLRTEQELHEITCKSVEGNDLSLYGEVVKQGFPPRDNIQETKIDMYDETELPVNDKETNLDASSRDNIQETKIDMDDETELPVNDKEKRLCSFRTLFYSY